MANKKLSCPDSKCKQNLIKDLDHAAGVWSCAKCKKNWFIIWTNERTIKK